MPAKDPLRVLIIGFGMISIGYSRDQKMKKFFKIATHYEAIVSNENFSLIGVVDPSAESKFQASLLNHVFPIYECAEAVPNKNDVDMIVLATPPHVRQGIMEQFPNLCAIIVEKPISNDLPGAESFAKACKSKSIKLYVNTGRRYDTRIQELANGVIQTLGDLQGIFCTYGNGIKNNGFHLIDLITMFAGKVSWVQALPHKDETVSFEEFLGRTFPFTLGLGSGVCVMVQSLDYKHYREMSMELWGAKSKLLFCLEGLLYSITHRKEHRFSEHDFELEFDSSTYGVTGQGVALQNLYKLVANDNHLGTYDQRHISDALHVMNVIESLELSVTKGFKKVCL